MYTFLQMLLCREGVFDPSGKRMEGGSGPVEVLALPLDPLTNVSYVKVDSERPLLPFPVILPQRTDYRGTTDEGVRITTIPQRSSHEVVLLSILQGIDVHLQHDVHPFPLLYG